MARFCSSLLCTGRPGTRRVLAPGLCLVWMMSLAAAPARAQDPGLDPEKAITQYLLDHWDTETAPGLPQNTVRAILQTRDGYLWLGTQEGLVRFDGRRFVVFDKGHSNLPHNHVTALLEAPDGALWIGTLEGLARLDPVDHQIDAFTTADGLSSDFISALALDDAGRLWVGTFDGGLNRLADGRVEPAPSSPMLPSPHVSVLYRDAAGILWVGTDDHGLFRVDGGQAEPVPGLEATSIRALTPSRKGGLWIGTRSRGLAYLDADGLTWIAQAEPLRAHGILSLYEDARRSLWIGTDGDGLFRYAGGALAAFSAKNGLAHDVVKALYADPEGSLWIGTDGGGLNRLWDGAFTLYGTAEGLSSDFVYTVFEDHAGRIWIGTEGGGITRLNADGTTTDFTTDDGLPSDIVLSFAQTADRSVWIGTYRGGLVRHRGGRFTRYGPEQGFDGQMVFSLLTGRDDALWIATEAGLTRYQGGRFTTWTADDGLASNQITALAEAPDGTLWVGTFDAGLNALRDGEVVAHLTEANGLQSNVVLALYAEADGTVWAGTDGGGLHRLRDGSVTAYTTKDGLARDQVFQILEDDGGHLWLTSNRGLSRIAKVQFDAYDRGELPVLHPRVFDRSDGLRTEEFNGGVQPSAWKDRQGRLWFATTKGVAMIDPAHIPVNTYAPPVVIEAMLVDQQDRLRAGHVTLPPGARKIEFLYAGLSLLATDQVRYRYRLEGYDDAWTENTAATTATYTNLDPGTYTFRVMARNRDGVQSVEAATVTFYLKPHVYETPWFIALSVLGVLGLLLAAYRVRVRHLKRRQRELQALVEARTHDLRQEKERAEQAWREAEVQRELAEEARGVVAEQAEQLREMDRIKTRFFNNISHEFRTPLTLNIGPLENALTGAYGPLTPELQTQLSTMLRNARRLLRLINQLLDLSKLETSRFVLQARRANLLPFLEGVVLSFTPFCVPKQLDLDIALPEGELTMPFDPGCLEKILFNLISNAIKFTPEGGRIDVAVERGRLHPSSATENAVLIHVADTGCGIPAEAVPHIFDRFQQVDGTISSMQEGTGIGLALVKELVDLHGGSIAVESMVGEGTRFTVRLPIDNPDLPLVEGDAPSTTDLLSRGTMIEMAVFDEDEAPEAPVDLSVAGDEAPVILIVDDNRDIRDYMVGCLKEHYRLRIAVDGQDALDQIREQPPDLILSDVMMPRVDGQELCRILKSDDQLRAIPFILLTAKASIDNKIEGLEAGADEYLAKPFNARELLARVRNLLALREHQRALELLNDELQASNEALYNANELKSQFLRIAAHDLKNPIHGIREIANIIHEEMAEEGESHELLDLIVEASDQMLDLIRRILETEQLGSDQFEMDDMQPLDLTALARDVLRRNRQQADGKGQVLHFSAPAADTLVQASADWLGNALDNLLSNAIKYSPQHANIWVHIEHTDDRVQVLVRDEGPGLSETDQARLFQKFQRLSALPTGGESSTGLGLAIVKQIVDAHGGRVWAESILGEGSTFIIELPLLNQHSTPAS